MPLRARHARASTAETRHMLQPEVKDSASAMRSRVECNPIQAASRIPSRIASGLQADKKYNAESTDIKHECKSKSLQAQFSTTTTLPDDQVQRSRGSLLAARAIPNTALSAVRALRLKPHCGHCGGDRRRRAAGCGGRARASPRCMIPRMVSMKHVIDSRPQDRSCSAEGNTACVGARKHGVRRSTQARRA